MHFRMELQRSTPLLQDSNVHNFVNLELELRLHNPCFGTRIACQEAIPLVQVTMEPRI